MYEYICGKLVYSSPSYCVIDCNGIGYNILISVNTFSEIKDLEKVKLYIHHIIRDDGEFLYGFFKNKERILFQYLITVSGVGANTARLILSSMTSDELYTTIVNRDHKRLKAVKGIGEKTSQRIVVDLSDKLLKADFDVEKTFIHHNNNIQEALSALVMLGFPKIAVEKTLRRVIEKKDNNLSVEEIVKEALKIM